MKSNCKSVKTFLFNDWLAKYVFVYITLSGNFLSHLHSYFLPFLSHVYIYEKSITCVCVFLRERKKNKQTDNQTARVGENKKRMDRKIKRERGWRRQCTPCNDKQ